MATTFIDLTNQILRELNEVELTIASFPSAVGIQAHIKDCVNRAYLDIGIDEPKLPFLRLGMSGTSTSGYANITSPFDTDPMYGNVSIDTTAGTRWYKLKPTSSRPTEDYGAVDWNNFYLTTVGITNETAPYVSKNLKFTTIEDWKDFRRVSENADDSDQAVGGEPNLVIRSPDHSTFGLSPIPDKAYRVWFFAYQQITKLEEYDDEVLVPDMYTNVIVAKARYYCWQFKDNPQAAQFAMEDYKRQFDQMRSNLLDPHPTYIRDDRVRFI
tara:strand:+ start:331 stop:1140 length:810 start_codon:yes stop_codon:yes gene_type:complete